MGPDYDPKKSAIRSVYVVSLREKMLVWLYKLMMLFLTNAVYFLPSFMMHLADSGVEAAARDRV